jgi:ABC-type hemin transport system substrate-binding protein
VREVGAAVGRPEAAERLAAEIERAIPPPPSPAFRYVYFIWKDPWMTVSAGTYVSDLLRHAGGMNAFSGEKNRYPEITPASVRAAAPDVLFFPSEPFPFSEGHRPAIESVFGRSTPIEFVDGDDCCWHGARTRRGLALMGDLARRFAR